MQSTPVKKHVAAELDRYSQQQDIIQGPILRHQIAQFYEEVNELPDKEFMTAINAQYGCILDFLYKQKVTGFLSFIKIIVIVFWVVPVVLYILYYFLFR